MARDGFCERVMKVCGSERRGQPIGYAVGPARSRPLRGSLRRSVLRALASGAALALTAGALAAQTCTADSQCPNGGVRETICVGNAVVTVRSVCIGTCRTIEERREPCAGQCLAARCIGAPIRPEPTPAPRERPQPRCAPRCTCANGILIIVTGAWSEQGGCEERILRCVRGCQCDPTPRCR